MSSQNENNVCDSPAYLNAIDQIRKGKLFNRPPVRYEILFNPATNPYLSGYSKPQLDMRRKAEILKYEPNKRSQTNKLTRAQQWKQIVTGEYSRRTYSQSYLNQNTLENGQVNACPMVYTSTHASDVPGPNIYLYEDETVPLYNYTTVKQFSVEEQPAETRLWESVNYSDVYQLASSLANPVFSTFATLRILNPILPAYTYTIDVPLSVYVQTDVSYNGFSPVDLVDPSCVQLWLSSAALSVYYSTSPIQMIQSPTFQLISDFNAHNPMRISTEMTIYPTSNAESNNPTKNKFFAYGYFGVLRISNLYLQAQEGYIYDLNLAVNFNSILSNYYSTYFGFSNPKIAVYMNTTYATTQRASQNCLIANPMLVSESSLQKFALSGE